MPSGARITDIWSGICCCHSHPTCVGMSGYIITGSPNVYTGGPAAARLTDLTIGWCGHPGHIVSGAPTTFANSLARARIGDQVSGCNIGIIVTGHPKKYIGNTGGGVGAIGVTISFQGQTIKYTEVDFGNIDDEKPIDDGLNIYPPVTGRPPTAEEIARSAELDISPTTTIEDSTGAATVTETPPTTCTEVADPPPAEFQLSTNFILGDLSVYTALSKYTVRAQHGLTVADIVCNLQAWAENVGEAISDEYGRSNILITSGFRPGNSVSQHERGQAADLQFPTFTDTQVFHIAEWIRDNVPFDQMILEYGGHHPWIHVSFNRAGNRPPTASNKFGTRVSAGNYVWGVLRNMS